MPSGLQINFAKAFGAGGGELSTLSLDFKLPRDLLRARAEAHRTDMLSILIRGTRRSVWYPRKTRRQNAVLCQSRTPDPRCEEHLPISVRVRTPHKYSTTTLENGGGGSGRD